MFSVSANRFCPKFKLSVGDSGVVLPDISCGSIRSTEFGVIGTEDISYLGQRFLRGEGDQELPMEVAGVITSLKLASDPGAVLVGVWYIFMLRDSQ